LSHELLTAEHHRTIELLGQLAEARARIGHQDAAQTLREQEFALLETVMGITAPQTLVSARKLANLYAANGQLPQAVVLLARVAEAAPFDDVNATQQAAFFLVWSGDNQRHQRLCRTLLQSAEGTENAKVARDFSKVVLIHSTLDPAHIDAAARLAVKAMDLAPSNSWGMLSMGMAHYRQGELSRAAEWLNRAVGAEPANLSLVARAFLAMTKFQQGKPNEAREDLRAVEAGLGPVASTDLQSPFTLHHDELAVWLAWKEARQTLQIEAPSRIP
jgi:tetratricopeptide (TPR) repeat protein